MPNPEYDTLSSLIMNNEVYHDDDDADAEYDDDADAEYDDEDDADAATAGAA
jgi:hypothetical protein